MVVFNDSFLLGEEGFSFIRHHLAKYINFQGHSDSPSYGFYFLPLPYFPIPGGLPLRPINLKVSHFTHNIWSLNVTSPIDGYQPTGCQPSWHHVLPKGIPKFDPYEELLS